ncbi:MAG TPA: tetratricopeptide repeat protein [Bryobacteraceae bacterium]|nr:tetratricopeptide repeat protein [Bryobacteraceae bacterium]
MTSAGKWSRSWGCMIAALWFTAHAQTADLAQAQSLLDAGHVLEAETAVRQYLHTHATSPEGHYLLGYILFKENNPKPSLAEYAEGARYRPPGATELEVMGCDYFLLEDYASADKWLTESLNKNRQNALALYFLGRTRYNEKRFDEAAQFLSQSLKLAPGNARVQEYLGLAYEKLGRNKDAEEQYRAAVAQATTAEPYLVLGTFLASGNRAAEAIPYLTKATDLAPEDIRSHRELGLAYMMARQQVDAERELQKAEEIDPNDPATRYLLSQAYRAAGLKDRAEAEAARYAELTGSHSTSDAPLTRARSLVEMGNLADAAEIVRRYLETNRNSADAHFLLGYIFFKQQDAKASLAEYTEGAKFRTPSAVNLEAVGGDYVLLHDYTDADKWFSKAVEWDPKNFQALYYLGRTKYNENRFQEAIDIFNRCLKLQPKNVKAADNLGLSYEGLGRKEEAMAAYRNAISWQAGAATRDAGPYLDLGSLIVDSHRAGEALQYLLEAEKIAPQDMRVHRELGKAFLHLNMMKKAQAELEKCVELAPNDPPVRFMLSQVYRKQGLEDKARQEADRYSALTAAHSTDDRQ